MGALISLNICAGRWNLAGNHKNDNYLLYHFHIINIKRETGKQINWYVKKKNIKSKVATIY